MNVDDFRVGSQQSCILPEKFQKWIQVFLRLKIKYDSITKVALQELYDVECIHLKSTCW